MGLCEMFMPEQKIDVTMSQIETLIRDKERAEAKNRAILGMCAFNVNPNIISAIFAGDREIVEVESEINGENMV